MQRPIAIAILVCVVLGAGARADESKPPWQRQLTGNDARQAAELTRQIAELEAADHYAEALRLSEEVLALRTKVQGTDHWQTVNAKWALTTGKKIAALPGETRLGWRQTEQGAEEAKRLQQQGDYTKALPLWQERLKWCREILGEDHPDTAQSYNHVAVNLNAQGKYAAAAPLYQKALEIDRNILGEDHPDTARGYNNAALNLKAQGKYAEAAPLFQKALDICRRVLSEDHPLTAYGNNNVAGNLYAQGKYAEAEPFFQKALDICRRVHGEDHPLTASSYNNVAMNLNAQARYTEAAPLYQKALDGRRKMLGENHPDTAQSYNNLALNLNAQGKYAEAGPLFQKALAIHRKLLGEDHPATAQSYNNLAANLTDQGKYAEAGPLYRKALDSRRQVLGEDHPETAQSYNNVAFNLNMQGKYAEAAPLFQKALDIDRRALGEDHPSTATRYHNVAFNLSAQEKYTEAAPFYQKALAIRLQALGEDHPLTATTYHSIAVNLKAQGKYAEAAPLFQKAQHIWRKVRGEDHPDMAASYLDAAFNMQAQGQDAAALASLESAARSYEAARLGLARTGLDRAAFGTERSPYPFLAAARARAGRAGAAWEAVEANLARGLLDEQADRRGRGLSPDEERQRHDQHTRRSTLEARILTLVGQRQRSDTEAAELKRLLAERRELEQTLAELAVTVSRRELATLAQLQAALPASAAFVAWVDVADEHGAVQEHWGCVVRAQGEPHWERLPGSGTGGSWIRTDFELRRRFYVALTQVNPAADHDVLARKLYAQRLAPLRKHLDGVNQIFVVSADWMAGIPVEALTEQYTVSYTPSGTYLARLTERPRSPGSGLLAVGDPVFPPVPAALSLTALPPGGLLLTQVIPGGAAANARLQAGDVLVAYAGADLTSVEQLNQLIAARAGDKSVTVKVWREGQENLAERELTSGRLGAVLASEPARQSISARRQADQLLARAMRSEPYAELPGTQVEIARLAELFDSRSVTTLTRAEATEQRLDELRRTGTLKRLRYLHFATHGQANAVRAFDSALVLTPPAKLPEVRVGEPYLDGRLTAAEVAAFWQLNADLVTLSACESGLGKYGGGDGILGFAQAFLLSGSRSVCLSLWQVDDTATTLLMDRFYRNLLGKRLDGAKPMTKAAALREAKEWLRNLTVNEALERLGKLTQGVVRGERPARAEMQAVPLPKDAPRDYRPYAQPRYWAAFVLIGDPE